ncbi:MAG TPA: hypothetical protein VE377_00350 [Candidatus Dormibacteraeota bacterium]|nr:hypothetical protein [Candidatus Dormibacteraeota bacterium]
MLTPFFYLLFVLSILLYVVLSPFAYLYGLLRCCEVWIDWAKEGKDVLVIDLASDHSREWISRLKPLLGGRAVFLHWSERKGWDRRSLAPQLFEVFGPHGMPEMFTASSLPAAIVFQTLRRPKVFTFGARSKNLDEKFEQLRAALD